VLLQLLSALSDPTTELGIRGLEGDDFSFVLGYVSDVMQQTLSNHALKLEQAGGEFQHMSADAQYAVAGAYAALYQVARLQGQEEEAAKWINKARVKRVLVPATTELGKAMQHDIY
jgi:aspartate/glutamate racemase